MMGLGTRLGCEGLAAVVIVRIFHEQWRSQGVEDARAQLCAEGVHSRRKAPCNFFSGIHMWTLQRARKHSRGTSG